jgi:hypothetical protein
MEDHSHCAGGFSPVFFTVSWCSVVVVPWGVVVVVVLLVVALSLHPTTKATNKSAASANRRFISFSSLTIQVISLVAVILLLAPSPRISCAAISKSHRASVLACLSIYFIPAGFEG